MSALERRLSEEEFALWIRPLQAEQSVGGLRLLAPNRFVVNWVREHCLTDIAAIAGPLPVTLHVGGRRPPLQAPMVADSPARKRPAMPSNRLDPKFTFENFVEGKSNQLARASAIQAAKSSLPTYNPLFIYGNTGLGKTHLIQAIGNLIGEREPDARIVYVPSVTFVSDMVRSLQINRIDSFKRGYQSLDALLIDDIQFFAGKERSQEEFFHTFNTLFDGQRRIVLTCDRYPKEVERLEERLKSRFGWGLTVAIDPPELETRVAILMSKAAAQGRPIPEKVALFIAQRVHSNVRDLEGALNRVLAGSELTGRPITVESAKETLHDLIAAHAKQVTIENIQQTVAAYFKIRIADLHSRIKRRSIARPRQIAMTLTRELTSHSFAEIGDKFGGRDHSTVIHACRQVKALKDAEPVVAEDYNNLLRTLTA